MASCPRIVLDTNVVLDWLVFHDRHGRQVGRAIGAGQVAWIATPSMREEYFEVLGRAALQHWLPDAALHRAIWNRSCIVVAPTRMEAAPTSIRCADPDDQMFVDLALIERPAWLLSRDKELLAMAAPLRAHGVEVSTPAAWVLDGATPSAEAAP